MHLETLAPKTSKLLTKISDQKWLKDYYLAGGTALALQYGHRQSVDLDFFIAKNINTPALVAKLGLLGDWQLLREEENTVEGLLDGVKISFMTYPYVFLAEKIKFSDNIFLASTLDIALMKLNAIAGRNTRKDFIDLYFFLHQEKRDLVWLFAQMKKKYQGLNYDVMHLYKSLIYFVDADKEPMPNLLVKVDWIEVKKFFVLGVKKG
jgi:predicted nucleotidyltransferase component of viral defense system